MRVAATAAAMVLLLLSGAAAAENLKIEPFDEASRHPDFLAFRTNFLEAVRGRDLAAVLAATAPDVKVWNDEKGDGIRTLERQLAGGWSGADADAYWAQLEDALALGGGFLKDGSFCAPYVYVASLPVPSTGFSEAFITHARVKLYSKPTEDSAVIGRLSYAVAPIAAWIDRDWVKIALADGGFGYLSRRDFRIKGDYHACFQPEPEGWRMTVFTVGE
ncbi:MAG: SH3 domain-containing protein [Pseudomonadota bacterium]